MLRAKSSNSGRCGCPHPLPQLPFISLRQCAPLKPSFSFFCAVKKLPREARRRPHHQTHVTSLFWEAPHATVVASCFPAQNLARMLLSPSPGPPSTSSRRLLCPSPTNRSGELFLFPERPFILHVLLLDTNTAVAQWLAPPIRAPRDPGIDPSPAQHAHGAFYFLFTH